MAEPTIGARIRDLRRPTYTQHDLAAAADVSVDVIRKLEQGRRHTASIATLARIARALVVDIAELLGPSRPAPTVGEHQARISAIRDALTSIDDLLGELDDADAPDLTELGRSVVYCWPTRTRTAASCSRTGPCWLRVVRRSARRVCISWAVSRCPAGQLIRTRSAQRATANRSGREPTERARSELANANTTGTTEAWNGPEPPQPLYTPIRPSRMGRSQEDRSPGRWAAVFR